MKGIGKPDALKGLHDEVQKVWNSWSYKFETWFCSQWPRGQEALGWARGKSMIQLCCWSNEQHCHRHRDNRCALARHISFLTSGMPYDVVFNSKKQRGLDAWRRLCRTYEPQNKRTNIRLLRRILNPPRATVPNPNMRCAIDKLEADIVEYESRGQSKPSDEALRAILLAMVPKNLEEHIELNIKRFDTYKQMRAEVVSFLEQKASKAWWCSADGSRLCRGSWPRWKRSGQAEPIASSMSHVWEARAHGKGLSAEVLSSRSFSERFSVVWLRLKGLSHRSAQRRRR